MILMVKYGFHVGKHTYRSSHGFPMGFENNIFGGPLRWPWPRESFRWALLGDSTSPGVAMYPLLPRWGSRKPQRTAGGGIELLRKKTCGFWSNKKTHGKTWKDGDFQEILGRSPWWQAVVLEWNGWVILLGPCRLSLVHSGFGLG